MPRRVHSEQLDVMLTSLLSKLEESGELEGLGKRERLGRERQAYGMAAAELVRQARTENKVRTALSMATRWPLDGLTMASRWPPS